VDLQAPRIPLTRLMLGNATLLSVLYLAFGVAIEAVVRWTNARWAERLSFALDALPAQVLGLLRLSNPIRQAYLDGYINRFWLRVVFGVTTVAIIFAMALGVGIGMWLVRAWVERASRARA
jgi:hypothetical protein